MPEKTVSERFPFFQIGEAEQFSFYRVPKALFQYETFSGISTDAKLLYGLLLDRIDLSVKNKWADEEGHAYIFFTIETVQNKLKCGNKKAIRLMKELEDVGLISKKKQFNQQPDIIYVHKFLPLSTDVSKGHAAECQNDTFGRVKMTSSGMSKQHCNQTDDIQTYGINTNLIVSDGCDEMEERRGYENYFKKQIAYDRLVDDYRLDRERVDEILTLLVDTCTSHAKTIRISGDDKPAAVVRGQFMKLDQFHISYVMKCMGENGTKIRNIKQYLLAALYNAPLTMGQYYRAWVNNDIAEGRI